MRITFGIAALLGVSAAGHAAIYTSLDTFSTFHAVSDPTTAPCSGATSSTIAAAEALGGQRTITAQNTGSGGCVTADVNFTAGGNYSANLPGTQSGLFTIVWSNSYDADFVKGFTILASQDSAASPSTFVFRACLDAAGTVGCQDTASGAISATSPTSYSVLLPALTSSVSYIRFTLTASAGRDVTIDLMSIDTPEPSTLALSGLALAALLSLRRAR